MALARLNSTGQFITCRETVNMNELFDEMSDQELEAYARDGQLPAWFPETMSDTRGVARRGASGQRKMNEAKNE
jgi:hypothetical protein